MYRKQDLPHSLCEQSKYRRFFYRHRSLVRRGWKSRAPQRICITFQLTRSRSTLFPGNLIIQPFCLLAVINTDAVFGLRKKGYPLLLLTTKGQFILVFMKAKNWFYRKGLQWSITYHFNKHLRTLESSSLCNWVSSVEYYIVFLTCQCQQYSTTGYLFNSASDNGTAHMRFRWFFSSNYGK